MEEESLLLKNYHIIEAKIDVYCANFCPNIHHRVRGLYHNIVLDTLKYINQLKSIYSVNKKY